MFYKTALFIVSGFFIHVFFGLQDYRYFLMTYFRVRGFRVVLCTVFGSSTERILIGSNDLHRFWEFSDVGHAVNISEFVVRPECYIHSSSRLARDQRSFRDPSSCFRDGSTQSCLDVHISIL